MFPYVIVYAAIARTAPSIILLERCDPMYQSVFNELAGIIYDVETLSI